MSKKETKNDVIWEEMNNKCDEIITKIAKIKEKKRRKTKKESLNVDAK